MAVSGATEIQGGEGHLGDAETDGAQAEAG
jgi:hypothetical protein